MAAWTCNDSFHCPVLHASHASSAVSLDVDRAVWPSSKHHQLTCSQVLYAQILNRLACRRTTAARGNPVTNSQVVLDVEDHDNQS